MPHCVPILTFGGDHEFLIVDGRNSAYPADLIYPEQRTAIKGSRYSLYNDGAQAEFGVSPDTCREYALDNIQAALRSAAYQLDKFNKKNKKNLRIRLGTGCRISQRMKLAGGPMTRKSGCRCDYCAYTMDANTPILNYETHLFVWCGFHIHIQHNKMSSTTKKHFGDLMSLARECMMLDLCVAIPQLLITNDLVWLKRRRKHYGRAGCYRTPDHGLEYRTLGGDTLSSPAMVSFVLGMTRLAHALIINEHADGILQQFDMHQVIHAINNCDRVEALKVWKKLRPVLQGASERWAESPMYRSFAYAVEYIADGGYKLEDGLGAWNLHLNSYHGSATPGWLKTAYNLILSPDYKRFEDSLSKKA